MKKLLLFALLCVPAFGQVHSDIATQNTVGNWVKVVPGALVYVCDPNTTDASCLIGTGVTTLYTTSGLTTPTTQPITADSNGNYTFYATPGIYKQCVKGTTSFCQQIQVAGIGTQNGIPFNCPAAVNGSVVGMTSTITSSCDPNGITDFVGHWTSQSYRATGAFNGTVELTGGLADPTNPPDTNSVAFLAPTAVPTPYYLRPPSSVGTVGQLLKLQSQAVGTNGTVNALDWLNAVTTINGTACSLGSSCSIATGGSGTVTSFSAGNLSPLFTTSVATATTTPALTFALSNAAANTIFGNFTGSSGAPSYNAISACGDSTHALAWTAGTGFTCQAISAGSAVSITATSPVVVTPNPITGTGVVSCPTCIAYTAASNPSAPTLTPNTPGSTAYSYAVVGCEDINCAYHSALSGITSTSTGNANLATGTMKLTAYADTLYGYRFYKICRTASSGTPASIGVIATGTGKIFIDNGLAGDGTTCSSTYASNTTQLDNHCIASSGPAGINVMPGAPCGVDAPPTTVAALSDEMTEQLGNPADGNDGFWTWINQNSATATWTGGMISMTSPTRGNANNLNCLSIPAPSTPYTFEAVLYYNNVFGGVNGDNNTGAVGTGLGFSDGTKFSIVGIITVASSNNAEMGVGKFTTTTAAGSQANTDGFPETSLAPLYVKVQDDGTNISYFTSTDGVTFLTQFTELRGAFFTTAPSKVVVCVDNFRSANGLDVDFLRRTQ